MVISNIIKKQKNLSLDKRSPKKLSKQIRKNLHIKITIDNITEKKRLEKIRQVIYASVIVILVSTNAISVYPSHIALGQSYEVITAEDISAIEWMEENLDKNTSLIASDHRLERMVEAEGFNTSNDQLLHLWKNPKDNSTEYILELYGIGKNYSYSRITHILIDDIMKDIVIHTGRKKEVVYMTGEAYRKFNETDFFKLIHESKTEEWDSDANDWVHWARVFKVNWSYFWDNPGLKNII